MSTPRYRAGTIRSTCRWSVMHVFALPPLMSFWISTSAKAIYPSWRRRSARNLPPSKRSPPRTTRRSSPERVVAELDKLLEEDSILVADPGTPCPYFSAYYRVKGTGRRFFSNRAHGALGYALAASVGAHIGRPQVKTVAVMGDGSFGMCVGELETVARLALPITFVVIANASYGWIKAGQKAGYQQRYFSVDFGATDHARVAEAFGVRSWRVTRPEELHSILKTALAHGGPSLVDIVCQPLQE